MTKTKIERSDLREIAAMRARWKEERAAGPQAKLLPAGVSGLKQKCSTNSAKSLMTIGADGPIRASAISASRSGVSALAQCSHGKGLAGPGEWFAEIFGPVLGFETFATEDEAIIRANATIFGLAASIFTKDVDRAQRVARAIKAGTVRTNTWESQ